ncbi:MAG: alpha/beta fold hydrolase [Chloroflexota bacterium]
MPYAVNQGVRIHYEVEGHGTPLILQHGFAATLWTWRDFGYARDLGKDYRLILVDARGHGESDKPHDPEAYRPEIVARDYTTILNDLGIEKSHYLGYSMGGRIALACLARYALERFRSFILGGVSPYRRPVAGERRDDFTRLLEAAAEKGMNFWVTEREKILGLTLTPAQRSRQLANDPQALLALRRKSREWESAEAILPEIKVPCLFFVGEADPSYPGAKEAAERMPGATFISIPALNHDQTLMHSELVLPHIKKFLSEVNR